MSKITDVRRAIADAASRTPRLIATYPYRPARFTSSPLLYVDVPDIQRRAMGRGARGKPVTMEFSAVVIVTSTWDEAAQSLLDEITENLWTELEIDTTLGGVVDQCYVEAVRGLRPRQATQEDDGLPVGPVGAVFDLQILTKL